MSTIKETLDYILKSIVSKPNEVSTETKEIENTTVFEISADNEIIGQIIGKQGKTIKAIRTILNLCYPNTQYSIEIKD